PYDVRINVTTLAREAWERVAEIIGGQEIFAAKLLNGEMPQDIEDAFRAARVSLFPERMDDLDTSCSCPDWSNPCKHIAAVYYLIGEEFDRDPFLLFTLRGLGREALLALLRPWVAPTGDADPTESDAPRDPPEPLPSDVAAFWAGQPLPPDERGEPRAPPVVAALPQRLGRFPFWRGEQPLLDALEPTYRAASRVGIARYSGDYATSE
ncbi:MAG: SWIM zinc finger family protein, partial [Ktedonobacterales bacterium]